jgi:dolichyl-phosphate-mannose--protein O-mannosyl transferase
MASHAKVKAALRVFDALMSPLCGAVLSLAAQRLGCKRLCSALCAKGVRFVREPDAGHLHVRFDERDVETE